ncbi:MAG: aspartate carbamoyltransferase catalytic subunit [Clostridiales bacterium]|nr:aspartate carbamoyltransferase catalytic subunit [Clostridiales bacterium]
MKRKDILGIKDLTRAEINEILSTANVMRDMIDRGEKSNALRGKNVTTLFYENSTRTRNSFETAAKNLGATTTSITVANSSVQKGESLVDTGMTLDALGTDVIVIRHSVAGSCRLLAETVKASVINSGDGMNEHPSQALLDGLTARRHFGSLDGKKVVIVGDIKHSRVARSDTLLFGMLGANVTVCAPYSLLPCGIDGLGCDVETNFDKALVGANIVLPLRVQKERLDAAYFSTQEEYHEYYGVTQKRLELCGDDFIVMHPGPINRGSEIAGDVADGKDSLILEQVTNGVAVRMAMLDLLVNGDNRL